MLLEKIDKSLDFSSYLLSKHDQLGRVQVDHAIREDIHLHDV